jgi:hypothetical protein
MFRIILIIGSLGLAVRNLFFQRQPIVALLFLAVALDLSGIAIAQYAAGVVFVAVVWLAWKNDGLLKAPKSR